MGLAWREPAVRGPRDYIDGPVQILLLLSFLLHVWLAYALPMTNDEAYYWDWGQAPQLSYFDHPPGVSYLTWFGSLFFHGSLAARFLAPFLYLFSLLFSLGSLRLIHGAAVGRLVTAMDARRSAFTLLLLATFVPGLSIWGAIALPDTGLMFGLSATGYLALRFLAPPRLHVGEGILFGLALGVAGIFKYHALPIAGGIALGLCVGRWRDGKESAWAFWAAAGLVGFYCCLPVWLWNIENDFASIRFQANHGFANPQFHMSWGLRIALAQIILLGGLYWWRSLVFLKEGLRTPLKAPVALIGLGGALPLLVLLTVTSFWKELLPHWLLPAFWVLLPFVVAAWPGRWPRWQWIASASLMVVVALFSVPAIRTFIVHSMKGNPGAMSELTIWEPMAEALHPLWAVEQGRSDDGTSRCDTRPYLAGLRWYTVAQLRFHLPDHPQVLSLDPHHRSYYNARDPEGFGRGCPVWVIAAAKNIDEDALAQRVDIMERVPLVVPDHEGIPWVVLKGLLR